MPRASLIIATHSRPHLLPRAVESALAAGTDVEVVIADDGSTDETQQVARQLGERFPEVKVVRAAQNGGVAAARNLGLTAASGEYLGFLDDDDVRLPGSLDKQIALMEANSGAGWCYGQAFTGDEDCRPEGEPQPTECPGGELFFPLLADNFVHCLTVVFRREAMIRVAEAGRVLDESLPGCDDWDLWLRLAAQYPAVALKEPVAVWRAASPESGQGTSRYAELLSRCAGAHRKKWERLGPAASDPAAAAAATRKCFDNFVNMLVWRAYEGLQAGHKVYARSNLVAALKLNPRRALRPGILLMLMRSSI